MSKKILVADDSPTVRIVADSLLRKHGYAVLLADDGAKALGIVNSDKPDLILLDESMPGSKGEEVCRRLKQNQESKDIPVIVLLSGDEVEREPELRLAGADAFIIKPFGSKQVLDQVQDLLRGREGSSSDGVSAHVAPAPEPASQDQVAGESGASHPKGTKKTTIPARSEGSDGGLDIIQTSDVMENPELSAPPSDEGGVHGFEWFMSELQKETQEEEKAASGFGEKAAAIKKKSSGASVQSAPRPDHQRKEGTPEMPVREKGFEEFVEDLRRELDESEESVETGAERFTSIKSGAEEKTESARFNQVLADLTEKLSERVALEVTKKISPEFLEGIIREEIAKLAKSHEG
ncbi:MAG: response regulator [Candidatus Zixiibacteriota bacterium]